MDQIGSEEPADPAAAAFDALRREVALLNAALGGLAAERAAAPDYSDALGEIAHGLGVALARLAKLASSPALALTPDEVAQQISTAGDKARRQDRAALHEAQELFQRTAGELRGWVEAARLASVQNLRLLQAAAAGLIAGVILWASLPAIVAQTAPERWAWPEKRAARGLHRDMWSAGERLLATADPGRWRELTAGQGIVDQNREALARCAQAAQETKTAKRCVVSLGPPQGS